MLEPTTRIGLAVVLGRTGFNSRELVTPKECSMDVRNSLARGGVRHLEIVTSGVRSEAYTHAQVGRGNISSPISWPKSSSGSIGK